MKERKFYKILEKQRLSNGSLVQLTYTYSLKQYDVMYCENDNSFNGIAPIIKRFNAKDNGKDKAYELYTEYVKNDVMDVY